MPADRPARMLPGEPPRYLVLLDPEPGFVGSGVVLGVPAPEPEPDDPPLMPLPELPLEPELPLPGLDGLDGEDLDAPDDDPAPVSPVRSQAVSANAVATAAAIVR